MKKLLEWENSTNMHPHGVCEAATMLWLCRIDNTGLQHALELRPEECDDLQKGVESGKVSWIFSLSHMLGKGSTFSATKHLPIERATIANLKVGEFLYIAASSGANGHAIAVHRHSAGIFFFNPGQGIYFLRESDSEINELANLIEKVCGLESTARIGVLRSPAYQMPRFYGG